jgi:hypothetical protein
MRYILILGLTGLLFGCGQSTNQETKDADKTKDLVDYNDRFDLANTVDTTKRTYNPKVDSTYFFPADSSDIVTVTEFSDYKIQTTIFPVRNKYLLLFSSYFDDKSRTREDKIKYRDYKLQVDITDHEGLHIKRVITKYDIPDSILSKPKYDFIREVKFKGLENDEFRFDIRVSYTDQDEPTSMIKYYIHLVNGQRFENYPKAYYDSLRPEPDEF